MHRYQQPVSLDLGRIPDPAVAAIATAYGPALVSASDRMMELVETPLGALALLAGLRRQRDGAPLTLLVRPLMRVAFSFICTSSQTRHCEELHTHVSFSPYPCIPVYIRIYSFPLQSCLDLCVL